MVNLEIAKLLYELADLLDLQEVEWKPLAYRRAARTIEVYPKDIEEIYLQKGVDGLDAIPGVGEGIAKKIEEYLKTGTIAELEKLRKQTPGHLNRLLEIQGIGPKTVENIINALNPKTIADVENACKTHKIASLEGFGEVMEERILEGIKTLKEKQERIPYARAKRIADDLVKMLKNKSFVDKITIAGSLRRRKETIGDIDLLITSTQPKKAIDAFVALNNVKKVIAKGPTKASILIDSGVQVDLRVLEPESWGAGLFYFTGSKSYGIKMRILARRKGYKLNEYGLFEGGKKIAGKTEKEICDALGVELLEPEERG